MKKRILFHVALPVLGMALAPCLWAARLEGHAIADEVRRAYEKKAPAGVDATFEIVQAPASFEAKGGMVRWTMIDVALPSKATTFSVPVVVTQNGKTIRQTQVVLKTKFTASVLVAQRYLARKQPLRAEDFVSETVSLEDDINHYLTDLSGVETFRTTRALPSGLAMKKNMVEPMPVILRGQVVDVVGRSPGVSVITKGVAEAEGHMHETIRIANPETGKILMARVHGADEVRVTFPSGIDERAHEARPTP